jgi:hypothetical protein
MMRRLLSRISIAFAIELFAAFNLAFLALDVYLAHLANDFAHWAEWIPVAVSALAPLLLLPGLIKRRVERGLPRYAGLFVGAVAIVVGVAGMLLHLHSSFFAAMTLKNLVYTAPFAAPLAYVGIGLLLLLNRMEAPGSDEYGSWVVFLALGGFAGNFALSLADHAQNGFFVAVEWVPVVAAGAAVGFLLTVLIRPRERYFLRACLWLMLVEMVVGTLGALLHLRANVIDPAHTLFDRFIYGAPVFAPLLFADLALLGAIGLWLLLERAELPVPAADPEDSVVA